MKRHLFMVVIMSIIWCGYQTGALASVDQPVEVFVQKIFLHGIPFDRARELKSVANIKILINKLDTDCIMPPIAQESPFCSNIVVTLGIIGGDDKRVVLAMKQYIEKQQKVLLLPQFRAKTSGVIALGYVVNTNTNKDTESTDIALDVLKTRLWKNDWNDVVGNHPTLEATSQLGADALNARVIRADELKNKLRRSAVIGLALSGSEEARKVLEDVLGKSKNEPSFQALVIEALNTLNTIITFDKAGKNGLSCYYNEASPGCQQEVPKLSDKNPQATTPTQG